MAREDKSHRRLLCRLTPRPQAANTGAPRGANTVGLLPTNTGVARNAYHRRLCRLSLQRFALLSLLSLVLFLTGCSGDNRGGRLQVVTTVFPAYEWARELLSGVEGVDLTVIVDNGVDLHSYQPSAKDIVQMSTCDVLIHVGGESDVWVQEVLDNAENEQITVISLMELLGDDAKELPHTEGGHGDHEGDEEAGHDHAHNHTHDENCEHLYDEHVWLSLRNARAFCEVIADELCRRLPEEEETLKANAMAYDSVLAELDSRFEKLVADAERTSILVGDRFPFLYLTEDYGLTYYAAFAGCEADTEASFETIVSLAETVDELELPCVLILDGSDGKLADTIIDAAKSEEVVKYTLHSMQSVTKKDAQAGTTYVSEMEKNYETLKKALGAGEG